MNTNWCVVLIRLNNINTVIRDLNTVIVRYEVFKNVSCTPTQATDHTNLGIG